MTTVKPTNKESLIFKLFYYVRVLLKQMKSNCDLRSFTLAILSIKSLDRKYFTNDRNSFDDAGYEKTEAALGKRLETYFPL